MRRSEGGESPGELACKRGAQKRSAMQGTSL
jgi:hypothetical protein